MACKTDILDLIKYLVSFSKMDISAKDTSHNAFNDV